MRNNEAHLNTTVTFYCAEKCTFNLNYPVAFNMSFTGLKKLFTLMFSAEHREQNIPAIQGTESALQTALAEYKALWGEASQKFANEYVDVKFHYEYTAQQKKKANAANKKLLSAVKTAKAKYDRLIKVQVCYTEIKEKFT